MIDKASAWYSISHACSLEYLSALEEELQIALNILVYIEFVSQILLFHQNYFSLSLNIAKVPWSFNHIKIVYVPLFD